MSAEIIDHSANLVTARISGKLTQPDLAALQAATGDLLRQHGRMRLLILAENFEGWERAGDWGNVSFSMRHDAQIEKMAIVGDKEWEGLALLFAAKGLRSFPIEYFQPADIAKARAWLAQGPAERSPR